MSSAGGKKPCYIVSIPRSESFVASDKRFLPTRLPLMYPNKCFICFSPCMLPSFVVVLLYTSERNRDASRLAIHRFRKANVDNDFSVFPTKSTCAFSPVNDPRWWNVLTQRRAASSEKQLPPWLCLKWTRCWCDSRAWTLSASANSEADFFFFAFHFNVFFTNSSEWVWGQDRSSWLQPKLKKK